MSQNGHVTPTTGPTVELKPFRKEGMGYAFEPVDEAGVPRGVRMRADYLKRRGEDVTVELSVESFLPGSAGLLLQSKHNLSSMVSARDLAKYLGEQVGTVNWRSLLLEFSASILADQRKGQPFLKVGRLAGKPIQEYLIEPLIVRRKFNLLYGPGDAGKGTLAVWSAVVVQAGLGEACGMRVQPDNQVLYLDWEDDELTMNGRVQAIAQGLGIDPPEIHYRKCRGDLRSQVEQIARYVAEHHITYVIVDSVEMACGAGSGDSAETYQNRALGLFDALQSCGDFTTLLIDHVSEEGRQHDKPGVVKPYGSVFKLYEVRWAWQMVKDQAAGSRILHAGLYHAKHNNTMLLPPLGFAIEFRVDGGVVIEPEDVRESEELSRRMKIHDQLVEVLKRGPRSVADLCQITGAKDDSVRKTLGRSKDKVFIQLPSGDWGLLGHQRGQASTVGGATQANDSESASLVPIWRTDSEGRQVEDAIPF